MKSVLVGAVAVYRSAIENPQKLIELVETSEDTSWQRSTVYVNGPVVSNFRTSSELHQFPVGVADTLNQSFKTAVNHYICRFNAPVILPEMSQFTMLKYTIGQEFQAHYDDSKSTPRRISAVGFLNDNYKGGELTFDLLNFVYEPVAGDIVVFPSNFIHLHGSIPITEGTKYSVVSWWI